MKSLTLMIICWSFHIMQAQQLIFEETLPIVGQSITTDNLGNWFVINKDQIVKYRSPEREPYLYSNKRLGQITSVDAMNPLKILVFYRDFSKLVFLDNTLSENGPAISLQDFDLDQTSVVCSTFDNGFWVFDQQQFLLIRFDRQLNEVVRIKNLHLIANRTVVPTFMVEYDNRLYMNDPLSGIMVFDIFGTYFKTIPIQNLLKFQVFGNNIFYTNDMNEFHTFDMKLLTDQIIPLPFDHQCCETRIEKNKLFIFENDILQIYRIEE